MAANAYLTANVIVRADGKEYSFGTGDLPVTIALTSPGGVDARKFDVATGVTETIWQASVSPAGSFRFFGILSDKSDVMVELQGTTAADNHHFELLASVPVWLASDDSLRYNAASFTGAADNIIKILVKNNNAATASIQVLVCE